MMKKLTSLLLLIVLAAVGTLPVFAAEKQESPMISSVSMNLVKGGSTQLTVSLGGKDVTYGMLWNTNCPAVAVVAHGTVTAVGPGAALITATTGDGRSVSCKIRVGVKGIDVSARQGAVDWNAVKNSGVEFALLRAGYGNELSQADSRFAANYEGAKAAGLKVGIYYRSYAVDEADAVTEANVCLSILNGKGLDYPLFLDIEEDAQYALQNDYVSAIAAAFCKTVEAAGYRAGVYSYADMLEKKLTGSELAPYDKWVAHIDVSQPRYSGNYAMWQYSHTGTVAGISTQVDLNYSYRDGLNPVPKQADISLLSDSPVCMALKQGQSYTFKFTPNGISGIPSFTSGNSAVLRTVSQKTAGGCYYVKVMAAGGGSTALYSTVTGGKSVRRCVVEVK
ncbi:MAG: Ig-like domain-containing protein [Oscillospiraceae bacterium]|jgi:GH25 family lysozyme M1 (1,4-beta-N-acetylmuramidase)|nr:Ig-like domain-containing protein [Oscillospiraceae bacterium]